MIWVGRVHRRGAGGPAARLISDHSREELQGFAQQLGIPVTVIHALPFRQPPELLIGPRQRQWALVFGAADATPQQLVEARFRWRVAENNREVAYLDWLRREPGTTAPPERSR